MKKNRKIYVTEFDMDRLDRLIELMEESGTRDTQHLRRLEDELRQAVVVAPKEIPPDVITMNSKVRVRDLQSDKEVTYHLVFPGDADPARNRISILAPIGTALIGYRAGDVIDWKVPAGTRQLKVEEIVYQPESAGDYHL